MYKSILLLLPLLVAGSCEQNVVDFQDHIVSINDKVDGLQEELQSADALAMEQASMFGEYAPIAYTVFTLGGLFGAKLGAGKVTKMAKDEIKASIETS